MQKSFFTKNKNNKNNYEKLGDSLSDTDIPIRRQTEFKDDDDVKNLTSSQRFATGDGFPEFRQVRETNTIPKAFGSAIKIRDEKKLDLRQQQESECSSRDSNLYKLFPIQEVSERSHSSNDAYQPEYVLDLMAVQTERGKNRPSSANRNTRDLRRDYEIRKPFLPSEESVVDSTFGDDVDVEAVGKAIQHTYSETTISDSISSYKRAQVKQLSKESNLLYQTRLQKNRVGSDDESLASADESKSFFSKSTSIACTRCCKTIRNASKKSK